MTDPKNQTPQPQTTGVKPLRWKGPDSAGEYHSLDGLWGYIIRTNGSGIWLTEVGRYFPTVKDAQAAAWSDYEQRISAVLISGHPSTTSRLLAAAAKVVEVYAGMQDGNGDPCPDIAALAAAVGLSSNSAFPEAHTVESAWKAFNDRRFLHGHNETQKVSFIAALNSVSTIDALTASATTQNPLSSENSESRQATPEPQTVGVPDGWKLVPIEPTTEMVEAGNRAAMNIAGGYDGLSRWEAMLSAAPQPPQHHVAGKKNAVGAGMAIAAGIVMHFGQDTIAAEILRAAGGETEAILRSWGVDEYDIHILRPALATSAEVPE